VVDTPRRPSVAKEKFRQAREAKLFFVVAPVSFGLKRALLGIRRCESFVREARPVAPLCEVAVPLAVLEKASVNVYFQGHPAT
jgi:hypothetical protein